MSEIRQRHLGFAPWADPRTRRLPGVIPVAPEDWLRVDDAYPAQMALRERLLVTRPEAVHALHPQAEASAAELLDMVLPLLPARGHRIDGPQVTRPDGVTVAIDRTAPLATLGRLCAEDFCLMQPGGQGEHVLTGAILCFPAGWTLAEKLGQPMGRIHVPVAKYTPEIATRVQRLLDGVRPGTGLLRGTAHHSNAPLHNPRTEAQGRAPEGPLPFIRVERQCLFRLPVTGAVAFSIHTSVIDPADLSADQAATLAEFPIRDAA